MNAVVQGCKKANVQYHVPIENPLSYVLCSVSIFSFLLKMSEHL